MSFRHKKSLGQHFLSDTNMARKIVDAIEADPTHRIIEIGPGTGALTRLLVTKFEDLHAIEVDQRAIEYLRHEIPDVIIHEMDIREADWKQLADVENPVHVVGNIPYNLTSPILFGLLEYRNCFDDALLMIQKEVGDRLVAPIRTKAYGILSVQVQLMSEPEQLFDVPPEVFNPPPKVDSTVLRLRFNRKKLNCSDENLKKVVRTAFNQRRKKIRNALEPLVGSYEPNGFDMHRRPEAIPPAEYEKLTVHLERNGILT